MDGDPLAAKYGHWEVSASESGLHPSATEDRLGERRASDPESLGAVSEAGIHPKWESLMGVRFASRSFLYGA